MNKIEATLTEDELLVDDLMARARAAQARMARDAGLSGFCYYHYWFSGRRVLHQPFDAVLA